MVYQQIFTCNAFQENTYLVWDDAGHGIILDPGCYTFEERKEISDFIADKQIKLECILNTHAHIDHVLGVSYFQSAYKIPFYLHPLEKLVLADASNRAQVYGFPHYQSAKVDRWLVQDETIQVGEMEMKVLFVPGHAPGHVAFYFPNEKWVIGGDVLFKRSVGRTDFPLCSHADLMQSIRTQLYTLADDVIVYPGHGPHTTIGSEKMSNPYVKA